MNSHHHNDLTRVACFLAGIPADADAALITNSSAPDYLTDVLCQQPIGLPTTDLFGHRLSSLTHMQRADGLGYCWSRDHSLGLFEDMASLGIHAAGMVVLGTSVPMLKACAAQPGATLDEFVFPSAADVGAFSASIPGGHYLGMALHFAQDACVPHHAWGVLRWGHQEWEDSAEKTWGIHREMLQLADDPDDPHVFRDTFGREVEQVKLPATTVEDLINSNAEWARDFFGAVGPRSECSITDCLAVCIRAVASTIKLIHLATKGAP